MSFKMLVPKDQEQQELFKVLCSWIMIKKKEHRLSYYMPNNRQAKDCGDGMHIQNKNKGPLEKNTTKG